MSIDRTCSVDGCARQRYCRSWCKVHYERWQRTGSTLGSPRVAKALDLKREKRPARASGRHANWQDPVERALAKFEIDESGCWVWRGSRFRTGYANIANDPGKTRLAHRVVYEALVGPIPQGLVLDHLCRVRHCINPEHLELVTGLENTRRGLKGVLTGNPEVLASAKARVLAGELIKDVAADIGVYHSVLGKHLKTVGVHRGRLVTDKDGEA